MTDNLLCSAHGRIRKIVLFDTRKHQIEKSAGANLSIEPVRSRFIDLINGMHVLNPTIHFLVFYIGQKNENYMPVRYHDNAINTTFIPVNLHIERMYLPGKWVQDEILIGPNRTMFYNPGDISFSLAELIAQEINMTSIVPIKINNSNKSNKESTVIKESISGGDILVGRSLKNGRYYVLHSVGKAKLDEIAEQLRVNKEQVMEVADIFSQSEFYRAYFHMDYFRMLAGPDENGEEFILTAKPYTISGGEIKPAPKLDPPQVRDFSTLGVSFRDIALPLYLFMKNASNDSDPDNIQYILTYTNCIVENFPADEKKPESRRIINIYMPDYRKSMRAFVRQHFSDQEMADSFHRLFHSEIDGAESNLPNRKWDSIQDALKDLDFFFSKVQLYIRNKFAEYGIYNVQFIRHEFFDLARSRGSLHCMTKVVERDKVDKGYLEQKIKTASETQSKIS